LAEPKSKGAAATPAPAPAVAVAATDTKKARSRLSQEDVPGSSLDQALRVARAIAENYAYKPTRPMNVAGAMGMSPSSGPFRGITGAAVAYGITTGAAQAPEIGLTPLGLRIVRPTVEGDDVAAKREALLKPKIIGDFLRDYDGASLPSEAIAKNVLQQKGVPAERTGDVLELIVSSAKAVGFIREWGGKQYVDLASPSAPEEAGEAEQVAESVAAAGPVVVATRPAPVAQPVAVSVGPGIHINVEIHIAADASSETVEEIFKNMRRYVLNDGKADDGAAEE
jgi:hypothetical protein